MSILVTNISSFFSVVGMMKSRAKIQKAFRQRLKEKNNNKYVSKERERRRRTYVENQLLLE